MKTWFQIPAEMRITTQKLVKKANESGIRAVSLKDSTGYFSLFYCEETEKNDFLGNYIEEELPINYQESDEEDLNMLLNSLKTVRGNKLKISVGKLLSFEIKRLTLNKITVGVFSPEKTYIRKVGMLNEDIILQVTGDNKGMTVWNNLYLPGIIKFKL